MRHQERIEGAINALREAQLDEALWPTASALFDHACCLAGNHLSIIQGDSLENARMLFSQLLKRGEADEELADLYQREYMAIDERLPRLLHLPNGKLSLCSALLTESEILNSPTYNEYLVPTGAGNSLNVRLDGLNGLHVVMALVSSRKDSRWTNQQEETLQQLLPHIQHFACVRQALTDAGTSAMTSTAEALSAKRIGIVLLNRSGQIVETNDHARVLLGKGIGLTDSKGHLFAKHVDDNIALSKLLAEALETSVVDARGGVISIRRADEGFFTLYVSPFSNSDMHAFGDFGGVAVMVMIVDPMDKPQVDPIRLATALNLTPAQARVAAALAAGATVQSIAASTYRSEAVVRWHLKQIMSHLGIFSQRDLVRIVLTTPGIFRD
ncbi:MAG: LuxR C-terminal-related transcriptional regulator [Gammaproteobacteria bacterium]|nr:LuxR C-terminal-related transcriptional regulator [Gammaproteobacteria bacterium]